MGCLLRCILFLISVSSPRSGVNQVCEFPADLNCPICAAGIYDYNLVTDCAETAKAPPNLGFLVVGNNYT